MTSDQARSAFWRLAFIYALLYAPYATITPYFQQFLALRGFTPSQLGNIQGALELMAIFSPLVWGWLSGISGKNAVFLALTVALSIPTFLMLNIVSSPTAAIIVAILFGFAFKAAPALTDGMTFCHLRQHGGDFGHIRIGGTIGYLFFLACIDCFYNVMRPITANLIMFTVTIGFVLQLGSMLLIPKSCARVEPAVSEDTSNAHPLNFLTRPFIMITIIAFLGRFAMMSYYSFFSRYLSEVYDCQVVGYVWAFGSLCEIPMIFFSGPIARKIGIRGLLALAMLGIALRLGGFSLESNMTILFCLQPLHMFTLGAYQCATLMYVAQLFPANRQSQAHSVFSALTVGLGGLLGSSVGGYVLEHCGYQTLYVSFALLGLLGLVLIPLLPSIQAEKHDKSVS